MKLKLVNLLIASVLLAACLSCAGTRSGVGSVRRVAFLGVETGIPPRRLAREMGLGFEVRQQGRLVTAVTEGSAAFQAGVRDGDVLLRLDDVTLYSQDDIDDFVSVHGPGDPVTATVVRRESHEQEQLRIQLGSRVTRIQRGLRWQYASLAQLPAALEQARAEKKKVLVGLSGAET